MYNNVIRRLVIQVTFDLITLKSLVNRYVFTVIPFIFGTKKIAYARIMQKFLNKYFAKD